MKIKRLTKPGLHSVGGAPGLCLKIGPTGARSWVLRTTAHGRRVDRGLGSEADVPLAAAREAANKLRTALAKGEDPKFKPASLKFRKAMKEVIAARRSGWKTEKYGADWENSVRDYALPVLGDMDVSKIRPHHVVEVLEPHWQAKHPLMINVRSRIEMILDYATAKGARTGDNPARLKIVGLLLPRVQHRIVHRPALPWKELPAVVAELADMPGVAPIALRFLILTAARSAEVRLMPRTGEVDGNVWTLPGARAKSGRPHECPLTPQAHAVLKELPDHTADLMFPGARPGKPINDCTFNNTVRALGFTKDEATVHGFRSTFRDWAGDHGYDRDLAEAQLQHVNGDQTERAYARTSLLARRADLMRAWADYAVPPRKLRAIA